MNGGRRRCVLSEIDANDALWRVDPEFAASLGLEPIKVRAWTFEYSHSPRYDGVWSSYWPTVYTTPAEVELVTAALDGRCR